MRNLDNKTSRLANGFSILLIFFEFDQCEFLEENFVKTVFLTV